MALKAIIKFINNVPKVENGIAQFIDRAVSKSVLVMERNIKVFTPVRTGHLRRSISSRKTGFGKAEVFSNPTISITSKGVKKSKEVNYAQFVEYGTRFMAPRAMFRKGAESSEQQIKAIFKDEAKNVVE